MKPRTIFFLAACVVLLPFVVQLARQMPEFGAHPLPYGDAANAAAAARHVTNAVSAVNFDIRGFDTLGEEFMLLCAVTGVTVLLRGHRGERRSAAPGRTGRRPVLPRTDAFVLAGRVGAAGLLLFGLYIALHAMTTPGGGFQGGVILACGALLVFLGGGYTLWRRLVRSEAMDACEGIGATLYAVCGFAGLAAGQSFGANILPLGEAKDLFSGGLMLVENAGVTLAVGAGLTVVFIEFLEETRVAAEGEEA